VDTVVFIFSQEEEEEEEEKHDIPSHYSKF
jgi:hypothetical protein